MMSCLDAFYADDDVPERAMMAAYNILRKSVGTPATDAFLTEMRAQAFTGRALTLLLTECWPHRMQVIDDTARNAADIARMILTSWNLWLMRPEGDFDRSFADGSVLESIAAQLRKECSHDYGNTQITTKCRRYPANLGGYFKSDDRKSQMRGQTNEQHRQTQ